MTRIVTFDCPSCGAPVKTPDDVLAVNCAYCGNNLTLPEHLRPASAPQIAHLPGTNIFIQTADNPATGRDQQNVYIRPSAKAARGIRRGLCCTGVLLAVLLVVLIAAPIVISGWALFDVFKQFSSMPGR